MAAAAARSTIRERKNWQIHLLYVRQDYEQCLDLIEDQLSECNHLAEYALYVKGLIRRQQGRIKESLTLFQAATQLSPRSVDNLKQVARSLYLLGRHRMALQVLEEAGNVLDHHDEEDWEVHHAQGMCYMYLKRYREAIEQFENANAIQRHDATYMQLGRVQQLMGDNAAAITTYTEALEFSPDNPEMLTTLGLAYVRADDPYKAFQCLGNSLTHDPRDPRTILAACAIIQENKDYKVALSKYRVAATRIPNSPQLWNNVGMCFFGQHKYVAAVSSLKRAIYLDPFQSITAYNLGLVHLSLGQLASAFHFLSAAINLDPAFAPSYHYLGVTLARLGDVPHARKAYNRSLQLQDHYLTHLNFSASLCKAGDLAAAKGEFLEFERQYRKLSDAEKDED